MLAAWIIQGMMAVIFFGLGILFGKGKGRDLIAGYNTMSERERAKYDEAKLMRIMRDGMLFFAVCMVISLAGMLLEKMWLIWVGYGLMMAGVIPMVILANTKTKK